MTKNILSCVGLVALAAIGCANETGERIVSRAASKLSEADCAKQRDECLTTGSLFANLACYAQYQQCSAEAASGGQAQPADALAGLGKCLETATACQDKATTAGSGLEACWSDEVQCAADVFQIDVPETTQPAIPCVDKAVACTTAAKTQADQQKCGTELSSCALDGWKSSVPPETAKTLDDVSKCTSAFSECASKPENAANPGACSQQQLTCISQTLKLPEPQLPQLPPATPNACADSAGRCFSAAADLNAVSACFDQLVSCATPATPTTPSTTEGGAPQTCQQKWIACFGGDLFKLFECANTLADCKD